MKKLISMLLLCALVLSCAAAGADIAGAKSIDPAAARNINIQPVGENTVPDGISPTTGRDFAELEEDLPEGFSGMVVTNKYYPLMVQHCGYLSAVGDAAPVFGSYADVYYEMAKAVTGYTRLCMIFNDYLPTLVGGSRSMRMGNVWIRQEWNAPVLYAGTQDTSVPGSQYKTDVEEARRLLGIPNSTNSDLETYPWNVRMYFDGLTGSKQYLKWKYRISSLPDECNLVWDAAGLVSGLLGERDFSDHNHTFKFGALPEGGDDGNEVYVLFRNDAVKNVDDKGMFYFNSVYEYEPDENVYYRYAITDLEKPLDNPVLFAEQRVTNVVSKLFSNNELDGSIITSCNRTPGNAITFANVVIQYVENKWPDGEHPYPVLYGTSGNADIFMGGKHYAGVWKRDGVDDRTVFYGEDGQEIPFQAGRTMIVQMDYNAAHREVKYE